MEQVTVDEVHKYYIIKHLLIYCTEKRLSTSVSVRPGAVFTVVYRQQTTDQQSDLSQIMWVSVCVWNYIWLLPWWLTRAPVVVVTPPCSAVTVHCTRMLSWQVEHCTLMAAQSSYILFDVAGYAYTILNFQICNLSHAGRRSWEGGARPLKYVGGVRVCFDPLKCHILSFNTVVG